MMHNWPTIDFALGSNTATDDCVHLGKCMGEVEKKCCGGTVKKVVVYSCRKRGHIERSACRRCSLYSGDKHDSI